jgi:hypothetical protein
LADCPACHPRSRFRAGHRIRKRALAGVLP